MLSEVTYGEPVNGSRTRYTLIGTVTLAEDIERRISYETASWYTLVSVPAGTYEIRLGELGSWRYVLVDYEGEITDEHFVNRVFGASSLAPKQNIGKHTRCAAQLYGYIAAEHFATNPAWELAEDWTIGTQQRERHDGTPYTAYHLIGPDGRRVS